MTARLPPSGARRSPRTPWRALAALALVVAAGGLAFVLLGSDGDEPSAGAGTPQPTATASAAPASTPSNAKRSMTVRDVGLRPRGVLVAGGAVWVLSIHEDRITRLDPETGERTGRQPSIGAGGVAMAAGDLVWIAKRATRGVTGLDPKTGAFVRRIDLPYRPVHIAAGPSGVWIAARTIADGTDYLYHFDPSGQTPMGEPVAFEDGIAAVTVGGGSAWVALVREPRVMRVAPDGTVVHAGWLNDPAEELAYGYGHVWASVPTDDSVARIGPEPDRVVTSDVDGRPAGVALAGDRVFIAANTRHQVVVRDAVRFSRRRPLQVLRVASNPGAMTAGAGHVWVAGVAGDTVSRIDP